MNDIGAWLAGALGLTIAFGWLFGILLAVGLLAFALRRRAYRRGTHPLRLLPWYLGGPPEPPVVLPDDRRRRRKRARGR
ncbi:MAG TPA: hypothetical protein VM070_02725 [Candidatus Saccharimonadales bacterium]|nr:hypothetical protein [Candidatus Saccharimonadales bacterium]